MRSLTVCLLVTVGISGHGCSTEETLCEKLNAIHTEICGSIYYYPCACVLCGEGWQIPVRLGLPDINNASCIDMQSCEGEIRTWAETCLENAPTDQDNPPQAWLDSECDPRYSHGITLFDTAEGWYNPAMPEVVSLGQQSIANCGRPEGPECDRCVPVIDAGEDFDSSVGLETFLFCDMNMEPEEDQICQQETQYVVFHWEQIAGSSLVDLQGTDQQEASFVPPEPDHYTFRCRAVYFESDINCYVMETQWDTVNVRAHR